MGKKAFHMQPGLTLSERVSKNFRKIRIRTERRVRRIRARMNSLKGTVTSGRLYRSLSGKIRKYRIIKSLARAHAGALNDFLQSGGTLDLSAEDPAVSIILVLYNRAELTLACLRSLMANCTLSCEYIIVDNASTDLTGELLSRISGAVVIRNRENEGFIRACNHAARYARADYLLFLNNDTQINRGAVERAHAVMQSDERAGAAGAKLILPDGSLQEAGGIIWNDGSCQGYGRGCPPDRPEFSFQRFVDYCSGAFLMTRRLLFLGMGGFDTDYVPAYYEDADFCMRLADRGFRTVYVPTAAVEHREFGSVSSQRKALRQQRKNRVLFREKHTARLRSHMKNENRSILKARYAASSRKDCVLYIDDSVPHVYLGAGMPRANAILHTLVGSGYSVTMYPVSYFEPEEHAAMYEDIPVEVEVMTGLGKEGLLGFLRERRCLYRVIMVSRPHNMRIVNEIAAKDPELLKDVRMVYDAEAVFELRHVGYRMLKGIEPADGSSEKRINEELGLSARAHHVFTVSERERSCFIDYGHKNVSVLGHALVPDPTPATFHERRGLLFIGSLADEWSPNTDSIEWFLSEIYPLLQKKISGLEITIIGECGAARLEPFKSLGNVKFSGIVREPGKCYDRARLFIAPTRYAAGIPLKVCESASRGLPVMATTLLSGQLGWDDGKEIYAAPHDDPGAFAEKLVQLYRSEEEWDKVREGALRKIKKEYSPEHFKMVLKDALTCAMDPEDNA